MTQLPDMQSAREIALERGEQAIVNGAMLTADAPMRFRVGPGASVVAGKCTLADAKRVPAKTAARLYYATLLCNARDPGMTEERGMLFELLAHCVASFKTREGQDNCNQYAAALVQGDGKRCVRIARRMTDMTHQDSPLWSTA